MSADDAKQAEDQSWENRVLCSDESCIGVIGPDGRCKECGLPYQGELPQALTDAPNPEDETIAEADEVGEDADDEDQDHNQDQDAQAVTDEEWARRKLCSDESCIGVIGPDGRCKECGKPYRP